MSIYSYKLFIEDGWLQGGFKKDIINRAEIQFHCSLRAYQVRKCVSNLFHLKPHSAMLKGKLGVLYNREEPAIAIEVLVYKISMALIDTLLVNFNFAQA